MEKFVIGTAMVTMQLRPHPKINRIATCLPLLHDHVYNARF